MTINLYPNSYEVDDDDFQLALEYMRDGKNPLTEIRPMLKEVGYSHGAATAIIIKTKRILDEERKSSERKENP